MTTQLVKNSQLLDEIRQFLTALETVQAELLELYAVKRTALTQANCEQLIQLSTQEAQAAQRLQILLGQRNRLLERAKAQGLPWDSISALSAAIAGSERDALQTRFERAQQAIVQLRHESWVHWIISHRCYNHYSEILELIAHCGQRAATYSNRPGTTTTGGAILDASC